MLFFFALMVKFGLSFICEIACVAPSLLLLPVEVSMQVIKILRPQLDDDEAGCIFQSLGRLVNFKVPDVECEFHVFFSAMSEVHNVPKRPGEIQRTCRC